MLINMKTKKHPLDISKEERKKEKKTMQSLYV